MTMKQFIADNREIIDDCINSVIFRYDGRGGRGKVPCPPPLYDDAERRDWVMNDEGLYRFARSNGVRV